MENQTSNWISKYLYIDDINSDTVAELRNFMILWNLFEARLFECDFKKNKNNIDTITLASSIVDTTFEYLQDRYTENNTLNWRFPYLDHREEEKQDKKIKKLLPKRNNTQEEKIEVIILVIYRYRNNLFHGEKSILSALNQQNNFDLANKFLIACLEQHEQ